MELKLSLNYLFVPFLSATLMDPDELAHNELFHQDLYFAQKSLNFHMIFIKLG